MLMSRTRLPTVTFRIVLQDRQPSSNIATRPSTNEETGYENASPIPSWNTGNRAWRADCRSRRRTAGFAGCTSACCDPPGGRRSEEHTSKLQSLMRNSYADSCWQKQTYDNRTPVQASTTKTIYKAVQ